jgi:4-amino-4-deoxy-L-arabinose transferase-like glycosyltransferase
MPAELASAPSDQLEAGAAPRRGRWRSLLPGLVLALAVLALLVPFAQADPPARLTGSNAPFTDEGFNLANARNRVLFGRFATDDVDRSLTNGAYSAVAAAVFRVTGARLAAGRAISMASLAAAVLLLAVGLAEPFGRRAALLAAAALGGSDLALEYGRLALVELLEVVLLSAAFVAVCAVRRRPSRALAALAGLLLAAAVSVKATALLPGLVLLVGPLLPALAARDRARLRAGLVALGAAVAAALAWLALVALPNLERLRTALRIWPEVHYPRSPGALAARLGDYLAHSDHALGRSLPLLAATAVGLAAAATRWRSLDPRRREALLLAAGWGLGLWAAIAIGDYAPNRYVVPALPGLAVLGGFGLDALAGLAAGRGQASAGEGTPRPVPDAPGRAAQAGRGRWRAAVVAGALGVAVATPGAGRFLAGADPGPGQRVRAERALAAPLPRGAVVFGAYAPTLLFDTRARTVSPWLPADANVDDPVGRLGVTHVLVGGPGDPTGQVPAFRARAGMTPLARVAWNGQELVLYRVAPPIPR